MPRSVKEDASGLFETITFAIQSHRIEIGPTAHPIFDTLRIEDEDFRDLFREQLRQATNWDQESSIERAEQLEAELASVRRQQKRLTNHLLLEEIDPSTCAKRARDREAELKLEIDATDRL